MRLSTDDLYDNRSVIEQIHELKKKTGNVDAAVAEAVAAADAATAAAASATSTAAYAEAKAQQAINETMALQASVTDDVSRLQGEIDGNSGTIAMHDTDIEALNNETVDRLKLDLKNGKSLQVDIVRGSGEEQIGNGLDLPFIDTAVLIPGAGDFTFKIDFTMKDGSHVRTGDMVLPSGGVGPDVKISSVQIKQGLTEDKFVVAVVLQDGTSIDSNEYSFPGSVDAYDKTTSDERYVRVAAIDQEINGRKTFVISPYVPDLKPSEIVPGSKRAVNVGQVHEAFVNADNKSNDIDAKVDAIGVTASIVEGSAPGKNAISVTVNGKTSKTDDLPGGGVTRRIVKIESQDNYADLADKMALMKPGDILTFQTLSNKDISMSNCVMICSPRYEYPKNTDLTFSLTGSVKKFPKPYFPSEVTFDPVYTKKLQISANGADDINDNISTMFTLDGSGYLVRNAVITYLE